ncbi:MAG: M14-type cytosolic carboxypeptidase [Amphiplicatus sp.]
MRRLRRCGRIAVAIAAALGAGATAPAPDRAGLCENRLAVLDAGFEGARLSACEARRKKFLALIEPENSPINPSPWYAFRLTPKRAGEAEIVLRYAEAAHRYRPWIGDGAGWRPLPAAAVRESRRGRKATLRIKIADAPVIVAAQPLFLNEDYAAWIDALAGERDDAAAIRIGDSAQGRALVALLDGPPEKTGPAPCALFVGRQHPPEVTGAFAMLAFLETVFGDSPLAAAFRARYDVIAVPNLNPDGVALGNWRHNAGGVDLNRDWGLFTQPETAAVKALLDQRCAEEKGGLALMLDFHSTRRNLFYTQTADELTDPPRFAERWLAGARARLDGYEFEHAERAYSGRPTLKNYIFARFGAPAITYEVGDETPRAEAEAAARALAEEMMRTMLAPSR